jgi:hypothetical protein
MTINATKKDRYLCHTCGGLTIRLTAEEAAAERRQGHDVELWSEIEAKAKENKVP